MEKGGQEAVMQKGRASELEREEKEMERSLFMLCHIWMI